MKMESNKSETEVKNESVPESNIALVESNVNTKENAENNTDNKVKSACDDAKTATDVENKPENVVKDSAIEAEELNNTEDDVPDDFFDDFLNQDFMEGLDIVDDDDWDEERDRFDVFRQEKVASKDTVIEKKKRRKKIDHVENFRKWKKKETGKEGETPKAKENEGDLRRDPEKTKRDIQNDKAKCHKDKQRKLLTERLDSGLVPPGMEMEIEAVEEEMPFSDLRERLKQLKSKSRSVEREDGNAEQQTAPAGADIVVTKTLVKNETTVTLNQSPAKTKKSPSPAHKKSPERTQAASKKRKSPPAKKRSPPASSPPSRKRPSPMRSRKMSPLRRRSADRDASPSKRSSSRKSPARRRRSPSKGSPPPRRRASPPKKSPSPSRKRSAQRSPVDSAKKAKVTKYVRSVERVNTARKSSPLRQRSPFGRRRTSPTPGGIGGGRVSRSRSPEVRRRKHYRDRSYSPVGRRRRSRSRSPKRKYKYVEKSFLEEIAEKLNETRPMMHGGPMQQIPMYPAPVPAPAPVTVMYPHMSSYDQQFFIGNTNLSGNHHMVPGQGPAAQMPMSMHPVPHNMTPMNLAPLPPAQMPTIPLNPASLPSSVTNPVAPQSQNVNAQTKQSANAVVGITSKEDLVKLYEQKKISLTDYLCIAAKPEVQSSNPEVLKEKVKVIARCQDAIKFLDSEKKFVGKLSARPSSTEAVPQKQSSKYRSPLLRNSGVAFPFTTPPKKVAPGKEFSVYLGQLLTSCGIKPTLVRQEEVVLTDSEEEAPPSVISSGGGRRTRFDSRPVLQKMTQTDAVRCENCERLKKKTFSQVGVQCGVSATAMVSVETQVYEEDILPKKRSLAALTPAQLLGKKKDEDYRNFNFSPPREDLRAPPPRTFQTYNPLQQQINPYGNHPPYSNPYGGRYGRF